MTLRSASATSKSSPASVLAVEAADSQVRACETSNSGANVEHVGRKVLVVDDSLVTRRYLERVLLKGGVCETVVLASSVIDGLTEVLAGGVNLVICDLNMPELGGLDFLTRLHNEPAASSTPVIILTGEEGIDAKVRCLRSGASDYLIKPFADEELVARAGIHLQIRALQEELESKNDQLQRIACLDYLTGTANRYYFLERLEAELSRASRAGVPLSVGMIDIDHFKAVNDKYGHLCGDQALVRVAELLRAGQRDYDLLARYGGEEFCAAFYDAGPKVAVKVAERCRRSVGASPVVWEGHELAITVSVGVASTSEPDPGMVEELISRADEALYMAKHRGRNRVVLASPVGLDG